MVEKQIWYQKMDNCLHVGLMGSSNADVKVYRDGMVQRNFKHFFPHLFFRMSKASDNTRAAVKKLIRRVHSVISHVGL